MVEGDSGPACALAACFQCAVMRHFPSIELFKRTPAGLQFCRSAAIRGDHFLDRFDFVTVEKLRDGFPANEDAATCADSGQLARANVVSHGADAHV